MYQRAANQKIGAGALANNFGIGEAKTPYSDDSSAEQRAVNSALVNWSVTVGRVFIVRVTLAFLYATGVLAFLGFLSTLGSDSAAGDSDADRKRRYLCALSVVVNLVAVAHYKIITKIRGYEYGAGSTANVFAVNNVSAFTSHNSKLAIGIEMAVDGIRHSDWLVRIAHTIRTDATTQPRTPATTPCLRILTRGFLCAGHARVPHLQNLLHCWLRARRRHPEDGRHL